MPLSATLPAIPSPNFNLTFTLPSAVCIFNSFVTGLTTNKVARSHDKSKHVASIKLPIAFSGVKVDVKSRIDETNFSNLCTFSITFSELLEDDFFAAFFSPKKSSSSDSSSSSSLCPRPGIAPVSSAFSDASA